MNIKTKILKQHLFFLSANKNELVEDENDLSVNGEPKKNDEEMYDEIADKVIESK